MIFHENPLLADDSHEISFLISEMTQNLLSAAVVIDALRANKINNIYMIRTNHGCEC